jgi:LemA protein
MFNSPLILLTCLGGFGVVLIAMAGWAIGMYNGLVKSKMTVEEAQSDIETFLKKRYDMIPNLVEIVKGYTKHEKETLENVVKYRNMAMNAGSFKEKAEAENQLKGTLKSLFAVAESYPDLKADQGFQDLQNKLALLEEDIQKSRRFYNGAVKEFNTQISVFPANLIAPMMGFTPYEFFEASEEEQKNVKVKF